MKYTFTRKQIVNAFNNKILDDDNFLTYLLSTTSKDKPMNQKSLDKKKTKELDWEIELYTLLNKHADKNDFYWTQLGEDLKKLISSLLQKQREEILNLECLKKEKITKNIFSITQLESRNQLRKEIKEEIKKL